MVQNHPLFPCIATSVLRLAVFFALLSSAPAEASTLGSRRSPGLEGPAAAPSSLPPGPALQGTPGVTGTVHDLSATGSGRYRTSNTTEVCVFCHTPHGGPSGSLWNRQDSNVVFQLYEGGSVSASGLGPQTRFCLSCHDGTTAFDQLNSGPAGGTGSSPGASQGWTFTRGNTLASAGAANLGQDLRDDHPVSIKYDAVAGAGLHPAQGGAVGALPLFGSARDQIECTSCHDPHESRYGSFLRASNSGSAMCKTCHRK